MPYRVEYIHQTKLHTGADPNDLDWIPMVQRFETATAANDEAQWLSFDDDGCAYRVVEVAA
jgi:hypothetical protein